MPSRVLTGLRELPNLRLLSFTADLEGHPDRSAQQFWAEYDAGTPGSR